MIWTMTTPVLSTAHVPGEPAMKKLEDDVDNGAYACGCFVYIGTPESLKVNQPGSIDHSPWLQAVAGWCWERYGDDCTWVRFDLDGDTIDDLEQWSW